MYYKNIIKNRSVLLAHDMIVRKPKIKATGLKEGLNYLESVQLMSNVDFKPFKGVSYGKVDNKNEGNAKQSLRLRILITFFLIKKITGQLPSWVKAKKSVANFNLRSGMEMGVKVTLRKKALIRYYKQLNFIVLPVKGYKKVSSPYIDMSMKEIASFQPFSGWLMNKNFHNYYVSEQLNSEAYSFFDSLKLSRFNNIINIEQSLSSSNKKNIINTEIKELVTISNFLKNSSESIGIHIRWETLLNSDDKSYILSYFMLPFNK